MNNILVVAVIVLSIALFAALQRCAMLRYEYELSQRMLVLSEQDLAFTKNAYIKEYVQRKQLERKETTKGE